MMKCIAILILVWMTCEYMAFGSSESGSPLPRMLCKYVSSSIEIDGNLDEDAWDGAIHQSMTLNIDGSMATHRTEVRALWDQKCLYIAFDCEDPNPIGITSQRDGPVFRDPSVVEVFVMPDESVSRYYEFEINPINTLLDLFHETDHVHWQKAAEWNAGNMETAVQIHYGPNNETLRWTVEIAIPFENFSVAKQSPPEPLDCWRINFYRYDTIIEVDGGFRVELCAWSPTAQESFGIPEKFGYIEFLGP